MLSEQQRQSLIYLLEGTVLTGIVGILTFDRYGELATALIAVGAIGLESIRLSIGQLLGGTAE